MISSINQDATKNENELFNRNCSLTESSLSPQPPSDCINTPEDDNENESHFQLNHSQLFDTKKHHLKNSKSTINKIQHKLHEYKYDQLFFSKKSSKKVKEIFKNEEEEEDVTIVNNWLQGMMLKNKQSEMSEQQHQLFSKTNFTQKVIQKKVECKIIEKDESLPYMSNFQMENMKPRRGRKPKKADICHLIYKNYGTVPKQQPLLISSNIIEKLPQPSPSSTSSSPSSSATSIKVEKTIVFNPKKCELSNKIKILQNEPLNLCIREKAKTRSRIEATSVTSNNISQDATSCRNNFKLNLAENNSSHEIPSGMGLFIHPMILVDQNKMENNLNQISMSESTSSSSTTSRNDNFGNLQVTNVNTSPVIKTTINQNQNSHQKRKRSAIFIPPVQTEFSSNNPSNEVSICKFKFTGGTKPSLQEKKILSVDSGGNFRYFSGTGDKSMRGYEFFPRENLVKSSMSSASHTNAFLNADSQKLPIACLPSLSISPKINNTLLNLNEVNPDSFLETKLEENEEQTPKIETFENKSVTIVDNKKRTINRSVQRRKLEKTFKEKGFLIQTQQLQSAEGATYCKFRQLRKFTRYLFRSWKDYLPTYETKQKNLK